MREVDVLGVRVEMPSNNPIVLLREVEGQRYLPIWIGAVEATAIAFAQQGVVPPRPLTHDLLKDVLESTGNELTEVHITEVKDGMFFATLVLASGVEVSARPSDSIALALRTGSRILCAEEVLDEAGLDAPAEQEDEVEKFREFLDQVSPEDFETTLTARPYPHPLVEVEGCDTPPSSLTSLTHRLTLNCPRCNSTDVVAARSRTVSPGVTQQRGSRRRS